MQIGLISVDSLHFPNLALMKLSAYHKGIGDVVNWYNPFDQYDIVYKSKIFTFTSDYSYYINNAKKIIQGGTGYDLTTNLFCDNIQPDYSIYETANFYKPNTAYGMLTRGCIRKCSWCIVPTKEGNVHPYMDIEEITQDKKKVILMDNNILASDYGLQQIEKIVKLKLRVDFNQGLDARLINDDTARLLSQVKWLEPLRMSCDSFEMLNKVLKAAELLRNHNCKPKAYSVYVLLTDLESSYLRVNTLKENGLDVFAQPFRDFTPTQKIPMWQYDMAHYCNKKSIFKSCDFKEFKPVNDFICDKYFK